MQQGSHAPDSTEVLCPTTAITQRFTSQCSLWLEEGARSQRFQAPARDGKGGTSEDWRKECFQMQQGLEAAICRGQKRVPASGRQVESSHTSTGSAATTCGQATDMAAY